MKLKLTNFRCWESKELELSDKGLILISGKSGAGKSSLLHSVYFALFGSGQKMQTNGKKSCRVELEIDNMIIIRTKVPNRLVVTTAEGETFEDDVAQGVVNKKFGSFFDVVSYIQQDLFNSFIYLSPGEKLEFLEKFAFNNVNLKEIKDRSKSLIKERNDNLVSTQSKLDYSKGIFQEMKKPEEVKFPLKCSIKSRPVAIKNEGTKLKNCDAKLLHLRKKQTALHKQLSDLRVFEKTKDLKKEQIEKLEEKIDKYKEEIGDLKYIGDDKLDEIREKLKIVRGKRDLLTLKKKYKQDKERCDQLMLDENEQYKERCDQLTSELWKKHSKDECSKIVENLRSYKSKVGKKDELEALLEKYDISHIDLPESKKQLNLIENKISKVKAHQQFYTCPSCKVTLRLRLEGGIEQLRIVEAGGDKTDVPQESLDDLREMKRKLEKQIADDQTKFEKHSFIQSQVTDIISEIAKNDIEKQVNYAEEIQRYYLLHTSKEKELTTLQSEFKLSSTLISLQNSVRKEKQEISKLEEQVSNGDNNGDSEDEEEMNKQLASQIQIKNQISDKTKVKNEMYLEKHELGKQLIASENDMKKQYGSCRSQAPSGGDSGSKSPTATLPKAIEIEIKVDQVKAEIEGEEKNKVDFERVIKKIDRFLEYERENEKYVEWETKVKDFESDEKVSRDRYTAANLLKEKILEAEAIAVENVISAINTHAQIYLEHFFADTPIIASLLAFKESKSSKVNSSKPQINLAIEYKSMECEFNSLSSGERARVSLAFTLALAEIFNAPLILLDECTSSLDQETTGTVIHAIKDNYKGKLAIFVCHNIVKGFFDQTIEL